MAYVRNATHQISMLDKVNDLPKYLKNLLKKSWAETFRDKIFDKINEDRFSVLYSDNPATRPNSPVNIIIGLMLLKELFQNNDEELIGELHFNLKYQYALQTTNLDKQPVSINTLTNFRRRLYEYYEASGIDLLQQEVEAQAKLIEQYMDIDGRKFRMDSLLVSSSCRNLSRLELIYSVNERLVKKISDIDLEIIPESCLVYLEEGNKNETIYRTRDTETVKKIDKLIFHSMELYYACYGNDTYEDIEEYKLLKRMVADQTKNEGKLEIKKGEEIASTSLQNPTDPDATYRYKYEGHKGYVANVVAILQDKDDFIKVLKENVTLIMSSRAKRFGISHVDGQIVALQKEMFSYVELNAKRGADNQDYDENYAKISVELKALQQKKKQHIEQEDLYKNYNQRVGDMTKFLGSADCKIQKFDNDLVRQLIESVKVISRYKLLIKFKSGIEVEQELTFDMHE